MLLSLKSSGGSSFSRSQQASTDPATAGYGYPGPAAAQQQQQAYDTSAQVCPAVSSGGPPTPLHLNHPSPPLLCSLQGYGYPGYPSGGADPYSAGGYGGAYGGGAYGYGARGGRPGAYGAQMGGYGPTNRWACVRLRGLPFGVHEPEINMFLVRACVGPPASAALRFSAWHAASAVPLVGLACARLVRGTLMRGWLTAQHLAVWLLLAVGGPCGGGWPVQSGGGMRLAALALVAQSCSPLELTKLW